MRSIHMETSAVGLFDLPQLCIHEITCAIIADAHRGTRADAARTAAVLALTCKDMNVCVARALQDSVVDPGCATVDDADVAQNRAQRARAAAELDAYEAGDDHGRTSLDDTATSKKQLRAAVSQLSPNRVPTTATKAHLCRMMECASRHREQRQAKLREFMQRDAREMSVCPVRPLARLLVAAMRNGDSVTRTVARVYHGLTRPEMVTLTPHTTRNGPTYALADVYTVLERREARAASQKLQRRDEDPLARWEREFAKRERAEHIKVVRTSRVSVEVARLNVPGLNAASLVQALGQPEYRGLDVACCLFNWLHTGARMPIAVQFISVSDIVAAATSVVVRIHDLQSAMQHIGLGGPEWSAMTRDEYALCMGFVKSNAAGQCAEDVAARVRELRFLHTHTEYPTIVRSAAHLRRDATHAQAVALDNWANSFPSFETAVSFDGLPDTLREFLVVSHRHRIAARKLRDAAMTVWPPASVVCHRLYKWRLTTLINSAIDAYSAIDADDGQEEPALAEFITTAAELGAAVGRVDAWVANKLESQLRSGMTDKVREAERSVATMLLSDDVLLLCATREEVEEAADAGMGIFRCPQCSATSSARYSLQEIDDHMRAVHD